MALDIKSCMIWLQEYNANPKQNWQKKDAAIFLITSLASKGKTQKVREKYESSLQFTF